MAVSVFMVPNKLMDDENVCLLPSRFIANIFVSIAPLFAVISTQMQDNTQLCVKTYIPKPVGRPH